MSAATQALGYAGVETLGWTLLHFLWQGALAGSIFTLLMRICGRSSARLRYAIGVATLAALALTPVVTFWQLFDPPGAVAAGLSAAQPAYFTAGGTDAVWWTGALQTIEHLLPWLVVAWLAGVTLLSWRLGRDWAEVRTLVHSSTRALPEGWIATTERLRMAFGIRRPVRALESAVVHVPMVVGWIKPVILIPPAALLGLTAKQLELLVAHELAHIRRFDHTVNLFQIVVETLLFYHPVVRWISARIREERELCCDDLVVASSGEKLAYARALAEMEGLRSMSPHMGVAADGGQLVSRINRLVALPAPQRGSAHWLLGFLLVATGVGMTTATRFTVAGLDAPPPAPTSPAAIEVPASEPAAIETPGPRTPAGLEAPAPAAAAEPVEATAPASPQPVAVSTASASPGVAVLPDEPVSTPQPAEPAQDQPQTHETPAALARPPMDVPRPATVAPPRPEPRESTVAPPREPATPPLEPAEPGPVANESAADLAAHDSGSSAQAVRLARVESETTAASRPGIGEPAFREPAVEPGPGDRDRLTGGTPLIITQPDFPRRARVKGIEGAVTVEFTVTGTGRVSNPRIVAAEPHGVFDRAVLKTVDDWRFEPFRRGGTVVEQDLTRTIEFRLDGSAERPAEPPCVTMTGSRLCRNVRLGPAERDVEILQRAGSGRGLGVR
ncbi:MAG TPA: TonB family protein [Gammaproteobacteria bacterium]|nr:TonB family protein [Gammaproteobacteria bacterium]